MGSLGSPRSIEAEAVILEERSIEEARPATAQVLVAASEGTAGHGLAGTLQEAGFSVRSASSLEQARAALEQSDFPVVVLDLDLQAPPGTDVLAEIRRCHPAGEGPLLAVVDPSRGHDLSEALERGADDCLAHPAPQAVALARVRSLLRLGEAARRLKEAEERFSSMVNGSNEGLWDWDLRSDRVYYSPFWKQLLGHEDAEISDSPVEWLERLHPEDRDRVWAELQDHLQGRSGNFASQHRLRHADGSYRWMLLRGVARRDESGVPVRIAGSLADVTASRLYDGLTGLPNRTLILDRIERTLARAHRKSELIFALLAVSVDRYDMLHASLEERDLAAMLATVGKRLQLLMRTADTVARLEGPNFAVLLDEIRHVSDAGRVAGRVAAALGEPMELGGREMRLDTSIGIALSVTGYQRPEDILRDATTAMNQARARGGGRQEMFDQRMQSEVQLRIQLESDLRLALDRGEFQVFYQPIVSLETWRISGFEALVRWRHPERGLVPPSEFIPVSEETGLIVRLGEWVLREAARQTRIWCTAHPDLDLAVSVNLSGRQIAEPNLVNVIQEVLQETDLTPASLKLELTETLLMHHYEKAIQTMHQLRDLGVKLSIDDFGTGYSSLSHLSQFPIDYLKVDRSFVGRVGSDPRESEIVRVIVGLGRNLGMKVIAEGIETREQLGFLKGLECDYGQGYYFARPLDAQAATDLLPYYVEPRESEEGILLVPREKAPAPKPLSGR